MNTDLLNCLRSECVFAGLTLEVDLWKRDNNGMKQFKADSCVAPE